MEWVETTGKTVAEAREMALDRLGVAEDDAEFEVLEEPRNGLFGLSAARLGCEPGSAPPPCAPSRTARRRRSDRTPSRRAAARRGADDAGTAPLEAGEASRPARPSRPARHRERASPAIATGERPHGPAQRRSSGRRVRQVPMASQDPPVDPAAVGEAAVAFMTAWSPPSVRRARRNSLRSTATSSRSTSTGDDLGLLIGPGGRTLMAVQDLARVAAQRRLGDHETRLRIDVAGYRERRRDALEKFAVARRRRGASSRERPRRSSRWPRPTARSCTTRSRDRGRRQPLRRGGPAPAGS